MDAAVMKDIEQLRRLTVGGLRLKYKDVFGEESRSKSSVDTDGWLGYEPVRGQGYDHEVTFLKGKKKTPSELMPRVHRVISLLKRWLIGTHQGAVSLEHLDYYLDEFTFRYARGRHAR